MSGVDNEERAIGDNWSKYWRDRGHRIDDWDTLSEVVCVTVAREGQVLKGRSCLEAGCGTGRISARLHDRGARVSCLDIAPEALQMAKRQLPSLPEQRFICGSILTMPRDERFDIIWNAGVLEHFNQADQSRAIGECIDVLSPGGKVIILTPYARCFLYRIAKAILEGIGRWPFGREIPVATLGNAVPANGKLVREYTVAFLPVILDSYKWIAPIKPLCLCVAWLSKRLLGETGLAVFDRALSRVFGGYLLVSVVAKK